MHQQTIEEKHYTVEKIAEQWAVSRDTARRLFEHEPGVLVLSKPFSKYRRAYKTLRVPQSVMTRVYARLTARAA